MPVMTEKCAEQTVKPVLSATDTVFEVTQFQPEEHQGERGNSD